MRLAISFYSTTIALLAATVLWAPDTALAQQPVKGTLARGAWGSLPWAA